MRYTPSSRSRISMLGWILIVLGAVFILQNVLHVFFGMNTLLTDERGGVRTIGFFSEWLALTDANLADFKVWTLFTYSLFHANFMHILMNALVLFFIGRAVEFMIGQKEFLRLYLVSVLVGGLVWGLVNLLSVKHGMVVGASAGVIGVLIYFCLRNPNEPITLLLFFVIPVTVLPKWVAWGLLAISLFGVVFLESAGRGMVAHSAHLGGMVGAYLYFRFAHRLPSFSLPRVRIGSSSSGSGSVRPKYKVNLRDTGLGGKSAKKEKKRTTKSSKDLREEVDRILDKINEHGFGSLTAEEKETLNRAKELLNH